jgi:hypothetical protein
MTHDINHNVATAVDGQILRIEMTSPNIALVFKATDLNAAVQINFNWSNDGSTILPLTNADGDPQSVTIASGATSSVGVMFSNIIGKYLHINIVKLTATVGIVTEIQSLLKEV